VGLDARIGTEVAFYKRLPFISGHVAYVVSTVRNVIRGISEHYIVEVEGERIDADQTMICVANGRYYGGGFNPVPEADPTDGKLDVLLVSKVSRLQVAGIVGKYKAGLYRRYPRLVRHFRTDRVRILCDDTTAVNLDGELRRAKTVDISVAKEKIRFFYPDTVELLPGEPKL
jgi:diacylglycerol kinase family enzyme